ncbi:hypothetical protein [Streptomyces sp. NPDC127036]|uniref:hypothetical protein n=1 Tax=Streptomyces sp. NPDC127036 TaxID=3347112 RepID=UPI0036469FE4
MAELSRITVLFAQDQPQRYPLHRCCPARCRNYGCGGVETRAQTIFPEFCGGEQPHDEFSASMIHGHVRIPDRPCTRAPCSAAVEATRSQRVGLGVVATLLQRAGDDALSDAVMEAEPEAFV